MFLEAVANAITNPHEVTSSEDLLAIIEECNEKWRERMKSAGSADPEASKREYPTKLPEGGETQNNSNK